MWQNPETRQIVHQIKESVSSVFKDYDDGTVTVRFMSFPRELVKTVTFSHPGGESDAQIVSKLVSFESVTQLRQAMWNKDRGTWLTATVTFNCLTEEFDIAFNYDVRPNVHNDDFLYKEGDFLVSPEREEIISDFKRYPRSENLIPDWLNDLLLEQSSIDYMISVTDPRDLFSEALEAEVVLDGKFSQLGNVSYWNAMWNQLGKRYTHKLIKDKSLLPVFVDSSRAYDQAELISDTLEFHLCLDFVDELARELSVIDRAKIVNDWRRVQERAEIFDIEGDEEIDVDSLDDEINAVVAELIGKQTRQRFPDLELY